MYTVTIPVMIRGRFEPEATLDELKRAKAERVLLALGRSFRETPDGKRIDTKLFSDKLRELIPYYESNGLEVGVWLGETMGHGMGVGNGGYAYQPFVSISGRESNGGFCCADEKFRADVCEWAKTAAQAGAKLIVLDDDWRMTAHGDGLWAGCLCPDHLRRFRETAGEELTQEEIARRVFTGGPSRYRRIWRSLMGGDMLRLAREIREAVDSVDPECRVGLCTAPTVVDLDGADFMEISEALAGKTRPYVRLIVAPYWAKNGPQLASVIASERMEAAFAREWRERTGAEVLLEGDVYPRPRFICPAAYLEEADLACRADGNFTGAMKYMMDYGSTVNYERGYIDKAVKNFSFARETERIFAGKRQTGFRPYEFQHLFEGTELPDDPFAGNMEAYSRFRGTSLRYLTNACVPVSFEDGVPVVFGENAKYVPDEVLKTGAVIDLSAAEILRKRGYDVGIESIEPMTGGTSPEHFLAEDELIPFSGAALSRVQPKKGAKLLTEFANGAPGTFLYENETGARFAVYPMTAVPDDGSNYFRSYSRSRELYAAGEWISRKPIAAKMTGNPDAYLAVSADAQETAVLILNLFEDEIDEPSVELPFPPANVKFAGCTGRVDGKTVKLSPVKAFGYAAFTCESAENCTLKQYKRASRKESVMEKLNVAIIGQGRSGRDIHGNFFRTEEGQKRYQVVAVADLIEDRRERAKEEYGCDVYEDYHDLLKRDDIDVVVNSTFSHFHYPVTMDALRAGKNVVCEKPFSKYAMECEKMIRTAKENGVTLTVFQQSRVAPYFTRIREILAEGKLGRIEQVTIRFSGFQRRWDWQTSLACYGGCLQNTGPHPLDQALQLLDTDELPNVFSVLKRINSAGDAEDYAKVILTCPDRPLIDLEINPSDAYSDFTYRIHGSKGSLLSSTSWIKWKYFDDKPMPAFTAEPLRGPDGRSPAYCSEKLVWHEFEEDLSGNAFDIGPRIFYANLYDHLKNGAELLIRPEKIVQQIRVMELVHAQNPLPLTL